MYAVTAVLTRITNGYASVRTTPTFFLNPHVQGITSVEGAEYHAREILAPFYRPEETVQVTVVDLDDPTTPPATSAPATPRERPIIRLVGKEPA